MTSSKSFEIHVILDFFDLKKAKARSKINGVYKFELQLLLSFLSRVNENRKRHDNLNRLKNYLNYKI